MPAEPPSDIRVLTHVRRALDAGRPVVALESSVFAQGLPQPHNADAARRMVAAVESAGAIAAITGVVCGQPAFGLEPGDLDRFLRRDGIRKLSARDLGSAVAERADGATTVAAAIAIASRVGARVFATGGIGGVHRRPPGDSNTAHDESADLNELASTPIITVCAGAKAILDLPATWERLETLGIPVVGFGTDQLPGFFTAATGIGLPTRADSAAQIARIALAHFGLGRRQGMLVVQPPPAALALEPEVVERAVQVALMNARVQGIHGGAVTPFLLAAVSRETSGRTLDVNLALLERNASLAAAIAVEMRQLAGDSHQ